MKLTILVLESNGAGTRSVQTSVRAIFGALLGAVAALGFVMWVGWQVGELTKHF
jgi:hypothetical protein